MSITYIISGFVILIIFLFIAYLYLMQLFKSADKQVVKENKKRAKQVNTVDVYGSYRLILSKCGPNKIQVLKIVREITGLGLKEAKDIVETESSILLSNVSYAKVEEMAKKLIEASAEVIIENNDNKTYYSNYSEIKTDTSGNYSLILVNCGPNKIAVIKAIRELTNLGLADAKNIADTENSIIYHDVEEYKAITGKMKLGAAGAITKVQEGNSPTYKILLEDIGPRSFELAQEISTITGRTISDCKSLLAAHPAIIQKKLTLEQARIYKRRLESTGAEVSIEPD